jgi:serine/threonine protein phosphatase PrpC
VLHAGVIHRGRGGTVTELGRRAARVRIAVPALDGSTVGIAWGAATDVGHRRRINEDSYLADPPVFAVADGMGGHASGDVASGAVVQRLDEAGDGFLDARAVFLALREATIDIGRAADDDARGVGTTVTGVALTLQSGAPYWTVFNVGDSRVYRFRNDRLEQVTVDHSVVQELVESGAIRADEAESHPESNVITRAVGFGAEPMPDLWLLPVEPGVRLLVCSDGLTREVNDAAIRQHLAAGFPPVETASALVEAALVSGGRDNITTVVVDVLAEDDPRWRDGGGDGEQFPPVAGG